MILRKFVLSLLAMTVGLSAPAAQAISLIRDAEIERFMDEYSRPIMEVAGVNPDSIEILIVNDQTLNAFATGRYMGFHTGLLTIADTPNQIEAVIAHEVAHIAVGESVRRPQAYATAARPMLLSLLLAAGAIAAGRKPVSGFWDWGRQSARRTPCALQEVRKPAPTNPRSPISTRSANPARAH